MVASTIWVIICYVATLHALKAVGLINSQPNIYYVCDTKLPMIARIKGLGLGTIILKREINGAIGKDEIGLSQSIMNKLRIWKGDEVMIDAVESLEMCEKVTIAPYSDTVHPKVKPEMLQEWTKQLLQELQGGPIKLKFDYWVTVQNLAVQFKVTSLGKLTESCLVDEQNCLVEVSSKQIDRARSSATLEDSVVGLDRETFDSLYETAVLPFINPEYYSLASIGPPRGVILYGPSGTGKTSIVRAISNELGANLQVVNGPELKSSLVGETERAIRNVFRNAAGNAPAVIFFDEVDSLLGVRSSNDGDSVNNGIVGTFLTEMDGFKSKEEFVLVIASTNRPDQIDPAAKRAGRFDRLVYIGVPKTFQQRLEILRLYAADLALAADVNLEGIAQVTDKFSGAELQSICREASISRLNQIIQTSENGDFSHIPDDEVFITQKNFEDGLRVVSEAKSKISNKNS